MIVVDQLELEHAGLADQLLGALGVLDTGKLHQNLVVALLGDRGLANSELVDSIADGLERLLHRIAPHLIQLHRPVGHLVGRSGVTRVGRKPDHHVGKKLAREIEKSGPLVRAGQGHQQRAYPKDRR